MIHVIANPEAGGGRSVGMASTLAREMANAGLSCHVHVPSSKLDTQLVASRVAGHGVVVACGGDGTVHDCLQGVMTADVDTPRFAIWPTGTGNDIARHLTTLDTSDPSLLIKSVLQEDDRLIDVGVAACGPAENRHQRYFLGVLSCGFDSTVNERANTMPARVGRARYLLGVVRELPAYRPRWFAIDCDGDDYSMAAMLVAVGNGPAYGSGMYVCPAAEMDDGQLDITVVTDTTRRTFVSVFPKVYSGRHLEHESVKTWRGRRLSIDAPDSIVYADGERVGPLPARIDLLAGALRFVGPPEHARGDA